MPRFPVPRQHQSSQWVYCYCYPLGLFCCRIGVQFWKGPSSVLLFVVPFTSQLAIDISCRIYNRTLCRCSVLHTPAIYRFAVRGQTSISVRQTILLLKKYGRFACQWYYHVRSNSITIIFCCVCHDCMRLGMTVSGVSCLLKAVWLDVTIKARSAVALTAKRGLWWLYGRNGYFTTHFTLVAARLFSEYVTL